MNIIHLDECDSTQEYLKTHLSNLMIEDEDVLVSTLEQKSGVGRSGNRWHHYEGNLAFSFSLKPHEILTLTSLEIGVLIANYFSYKYRKNIHLKWPNDLLDDMGDKCGGIIVHNSGNRLVIGVGLNLIEDKTPVKDEYPHGFIFSHNIFTDNYKKIIPEKIYEYILENRLRSDEIISSWQSMSFHRNKLVTFEDGKKLSSGIFLGIGSEGQAFIEENGVIRSVFSGSIRLIPIPQ